MVQKGQKRNQRRGGEKKKEEKKFVNKKGTGSGETKRQ
jgi:hypothetical protein